MGLGTLITAIEYLEYQESQKKAAIALNKQAAAVVNKSHLQLRRVNSSVPGSMIINSESGRISTKRPLPMRAAPEDNSLVLRFLPSSISSSGHDDPITVGSLVAINTTAPTAADNLDDEADDDQIAKRRRIHNALEKSRRAQMRVNLDALKDILPPPTTHSGVAYGRVQTTSSTLELSAKVIKHLEAEGKQLEIQLDQLNQTKLEMEHRAAQLMGDVGIQQLLTRDLRILELVEGKDDELRTRDYDDNTIPADVVEAKNPTGIQHNNNNNNPRGQNDVDILTLPGSSFGFSPVPAGFHATEETFTITPVSSNFSIDTATVRDMISPNHSDGWPLTMSSSSRRGKNLPQNQHLHPHRGFSQLGCFNKHYKTLPIASFPTSNSFLTITPAPPPPLTQLSMTNGFCNSLPFYSLSGGGGIGGSGGARVTSSPALNYNGGSTHCYPVDTAATAHNVLPPPPILHRFKSSGYGCEYHINSPPSIQFCWIDVGKDRSS